MSSINIAQLKHHLFSPVIKKFLNFYIFTILNAVVGFYSVSYLTKNILPDQYGMIGIFLGILFFIPSLLSFCVNALQSINIIDLPQEAYLYFRDCYISFVILLTIIFTGISVIIGAYLPIYYFSIVAAVLTGMLQLLSSIHSTELVLASKATSFGILNLLTVICSLLITIILVSFTDLNWQGRILGLFFSELIIFIIRFWVISPIGKTFKFRFDLKQYIHFFHYGWPLMIAVVAGWIINQSDRFILLHYFTLSEVGYYSVAYSVCTIITTINQTMIRTLAPDIYEKLSKKQGKKMIFRINIVYSIVILTIAGLISLAALFSFKFIFGIKYLKSMPIIVILCFSQAFFGIYSTLGIVIDYFKYNRLKLLLVWISAVMCVLVSILFIPFLKFYSPAIGGLFSFITLSLISYLQVKKICSDQNIL